MTNLFKNRLLSTAQAFSRDRSGNFGVIVAVGMTALLAALGAGIDMTGAAAEKSRLQDISDSAVLAAAASGETTVGKLKFIVDDIMDVHEDKSRPIKYKVAINDDNIVVSASSTYNTAIMAIFGYKEIQLNVESGAPVAQEMPIHVSLVVDTTDSMAGANLSSLQKAAEGLIKKVEKSKSAGAKMAVVPFGNYVNIGMGNRNAAWMDVPADFTETRPCYMARPVKSVSGCSTVTKTRYNDGIAEDYEGNEGCVYEYEDFEIEYCPPPKDIEWRGCAGSRNEPLNIIAAAGNSTEIPGAMGVSCGSEMLPLTDNFGDVESAIDNLTTSGNTYLPTGLIWGWRALSPAAPFGNSDVSDETVRAMVFMTDGGNTMNQWDKDGSGDKAYHRTISPSDIAAHKEASDRMLAVCDGIKADGITLFTVGYKLPAGAAGDSADLHACASSSSTAFSAENSKELEAAFKDIGKALATVRLTF